MPEPQPLLSCWRPPLEPALPQSQTVAASRHGIRQMHRVKSRASAYRVHTQPALHTLLPVTCPSVLSQPACKPACKPCDSPSAFPPRLLPPAPRRHLPLPPAHLSKHMSFSNTNGRLPVREASTSVHT